MKWVFQRPCKLKVARSWIIAKKGRSLVDML